MGEMKGDEVFCFNINSYQFDNNNNNNKKSVRGFAGF